MVTRYLGERRGGERGSAFWLPIIMAVLAMLGSVYIQMTHNDRETAQRVSALEAHQTDTTDAVHRIEAKVDKLIDGLLGQK
jgi:hypothetical protein